MFGYCKKHDKSFSGPPGTVCPGCAEESLNHTEKQWRVGGLDLAKVHDYTAMVELDVRFHHAKVVSVKVWPHTDYSIIIADVTRRYHAVDMELIGVDATSGSVGDPIAEMLRKNGVHTDDIKFGEYVDYTNPWGVYKHSPVKQAMVEYDRACKQSGFVETPKNGTEELRRQLDEQYIVDSASERVRYSHPEGRHDDLAWAYLIALYVSRRWITGTEGWLKSPQMMQ